MKLKKFFAGVLAAAMMLTVGATAAFATTPVTDGSNGNTGSSQTYTPVDADDDLGIMKNYKVEKGTAPKETFNFSVKYVSGKSKPYTSTYTYEGTATASFENNMEANVKAYQSALNIKIKNFGLPAGPGKYCFEIK